MRLLAGGLAALLMIGAAQAQVTLRVKDADGAVQTLLGHNGGGSSLWLNGSWCDPTTPNLCAVVSGNNALKVFIDPATTPTVNLGGIGGGASAANQLAPLGPVTPGSAASASALVGCQYNSSSPTPSPTQQVAVNCDNQGNINVDIARVTGIVEGSSSAGQTGALVMGTVVSSTPSFTAGTSHMLSMGLDGKLRVSTTSALASRSGKQVEAPIHICGNHVTINPTSASHTELVKPVEGQVVYVCDYNFSSAGANAINLESNGKAIDTVWYLAANTLKADANAYYRGLATAAGDGVSLKSTGTMALSFTLYYDQY